MPKGPKGQKRPADVIGNAIKIARIATGEEEEDFPADDGKDKAAQSLGRRGGRARADTLTAKRRSEIAKKGAQARADITEGNVAEAKKAGKDAAAAGKKPNRMVPLGFRSRSSSYC